MLERLENAGLIFSKGEESKNISNKLKGKKIVISGIFKNYSRGELVNIVEINGGEIKSSVSSAISFIIGGDKISYKRSFPILSCIGHQILYCGEIGKATTMKVVTNYLASLNLLALGEALMVCKKYGLDLKTAYNGIKISSGNSFVHETESQVILNGSYDVGFTMDLVCKDVNLFDKLIDKFNIPAELLSLIHI